MTQLLIDRATLEKLVVALEGVAVLIEHQYTGTHEGMNALQNASDDAQAAITALRATIANAEQAEPEPKLWLWKNFVDGKQEYWVFDNLYPININDGDPQTLGDPCGYALFKPSRNGRKEQQ